MRPTFTQESDFRQQRDFGQKFTATFEFIGAHWQGLGSALAYIVLPAAIGSGIMNGLVQLNMQNQLRAAGSAGAGMAARIGALGSLTQSPFYWLNIVVSIVFLTLLALTVYGYMRLCLRPTPSPSPLLPARCGQRCGRTLWAHFSPTSHWPSSRALASCF